MQIVVGDDVVGDAHAVEPAGEVRIGRQVAQARARRVVEGEIVGPPAQHRPQVRRVGHARAVAVEIVGREAVILVVVGIVGGGLPVGDPFAERLVEDAPREIGVDLIGEGRGDVADLAARLADLRAHEEGDDIAMRPAAQLDAVDAASHVLGNREAEIVGPAAIVQVVVVEMDGGVLMRRCLPVALLAGPRRALHGAGRQVHQPAVQPVRPAILDLHGGHAAGEVPRRHARDARRLDLAVEAALRRTVARCLGADQDGLWRVEGEGRRRGIGLALVVDGEGALQWLLAHAQHAGRGIGAGPHAIPDARAQFLAHHDARIAAFQRHAVLCQHQREARTCRGFAPRDHGLRPVLGQGRPDQRLDRERALQRHVPGAPDQRIGAGPGVLLARGEAAVEQFGLVFEFGRQSAGIGIATDDAHQHGVIRARARARNLEGDLFAGPYRDAVGIAGQRCCHVCLPLSRRYSRPKTGSIP